MRAAIAIALLAALLAGCGSGAGSAPQHKPVAEQPAPAPAPTVSDPPPGPPARMDEASFWRLITETRSAADGYTGRQSELLEERLRRLPSTQVAAFERIRHRLDQRAYTWDLWGAAYVIDDGCSNDCFRDFRGYLISLGRGPYEQALRDPDSLAPVVQDAEEGDWENADDPAPDGDQSAELSGDPRGDPWDDSHVEKLVRRYPKLAARFRS